MGSISNAVTTRLNSVDWKSIASSGWYDASMEAVSRGIMDGMSGFSIVVLNTETMAVVPSVGMYGSYMELMLVVKERAVGGGFVKIFGAVESWLNGNAGLGLSVGTMEMSAPRLRFQGFEAYAVTRMSDVEKCTDSTEAWDVIGSMLEHCMTTLQVPVTGFYGNSPTPTFTPQGRFL